MLLREREKSRKWHKQGNQVTSSQGIPVSVEVTLLVLLQILIVAQLPQKNLLKKEAERYGMLGGNLRRVLCQLASHKDWKQLKYLDQLY